MYDVSSCRINSPVHVWRQLIQKVFPSACMTSALTESISLWMYDVSSYRKYSLVHVWRQVLKKVFPQCMLFHWWLCHWCLHVYNAFPVKLVMNVGFQCIGGSRSTLQLMHPSINPIVHLKKYCKYRDCFVVLCLHVYNAFPVKPEMDGQFLCRAGSRSKLHLTQYVNLEVYCKYCQYYYLYLAKL
jgi:hypothetical protein